jgi:hypothetical protein
MGSFAGQNRKGCGAVRVPERPFTGRPPLPLVAPGLLIIHCTTGGPPEDPETITRFTSVHLLVLPGMSMQHLMEI